MTDTLAFSARAPRRVNLSKPLPRSKSMTEAVEVLPPSPTEIEQFKASARRGSTKLAKPIPRSKSVTEETSELDQDTFVKHRLKSQVSVDSGVGDCNNNSSLIGDETKTYTADELLKIGASPLSKKTPESWDDLVLLLPEVCLSKVTTYMDTLTYQQERGYMIECHYVRQSHDYSSKAQQHRHYNNERVPSENEVNEPTPKWTIPANFNVPIERKGFGTPSAKKNFDQIQQVEEVAEV